MRRDWRRTLPRHSSSQPKWAARAAVAGCPAPSIIQRCMRLAAPRPRASNAATKPHLCKKQHSGQLLALCGARIGAEARARRPIGRGHDLARRNQAPPAAATPKRVDSTSRARPTGPTRTSGAELRTRRGRGGAAWGTPGRVWGREGAGAGVNLRSYFWAFLSGWYWAPVWVLSAS